MPPALNRFPRQSLIHAGQTYQAVDDAAHGGGLTEPHAKNSGYKIEVKHARKAPVQRADHYKRGCNYVKLFHVVFLSCRFQFRSRLCFDPK